MTHLEQVITGEFRKSLVDLVSHYAGEAPRLNHDSDFVLESKVAATVGFGDPNFRGSATLMTDAVKASQLGNHSEVSLADWLGELGNQLVGRFKNKLVAYGRSVSLGLPVRVLGEDIAVSGLRTGAWTVDWGQQKLLVVFDLEILADFELEVDPGASTAEEGSFCLF